MAQDLRDSKRNILKCIKTWYLNKLCTSSKVPTYLQNKSPSHKEAQEYDYIVIKLYFCIVARLPELLSPYPNTSSTSHRYLLNGGFFCTFPANSIAKITKNSLKLCPSEGCSNQ